MDVATSNCRSISADMSQNYNSERQPLIHNFSCPHLLWRISFFHKLKYDRHLSKNCWTTFKDADRLHRLHKKTLTHRTDSSQIICLQKWHLPSIPFYGQETTPDPLLILVYYWVRTKGKPISCTGNPLVRTADGLIVEFCLYKDRQLAFHIAMLE